MKIALWNLGSLEHNIVPTQKAIDRLRELVKNLDENKEELQHLIVGPEVSVKIVDTEDASFAFDVNDIQQLIDLKEENEKEEV